MKVLHITAILVLLIASAGIAATEEKLPAISSMEPIIGNNIATASEKAIQALRRELLKNRKLQLPPAGSSIGLSYELPQPNGTKLRVRFLSALAPDVTPYDAQAGVMVTQDGKSVLAEIEGMLTTERLLPPVQPQPPPSPLVPKPTPPLPFEADGYEFSFSGVSNELSWKRNRNDQIDWSRTAGSIQPKSVGEALQTIDSSFFQNAKGLIFVGTASEEQPLGKEVEEGLALSRAISMAGTPLLGFTGSCYTLSLGVHETTALTNGGKKIPPSLQTAYQRSLIVIAINVYAKGSAPYDQDSLERALRKGLIQLREQKAELREKIRAMGVVIENFSLDANKKLNLMPYLPAKPKGKP